MEKIAMIKTAEVYGVMSSLVENGAVKVASESAFNSLTSIVANTIPGAEYSLEDVLSKTAEVLDEVQDMSEEELAELAAVIEAEEAAQEAEVIPEDLVDADPEMPKEASENENEMDLKAQYGELAMAKVAGDISDEYFDKEASKILDALKGAKSFVGKGLKGEGIKDSVKNLRSSQGLAGQARTAQKDLLGAAKKLKSQGYTGAASQRLKDATGAGKTKKMYQDLAFSDKKQVGRAVGRSAAAYGGAAALTGGAALGANRLLGNRE